MEIMLYASIVFVLSRMLAFGHSFQSLGGHLIEGTTSLTHGLSQKPHVLELGGSVLLCRLKHGSYAAHRPSTIWADQIPSNEVRPVQLRRRLSRWSRCWCSAGLV